MAESSSLQTRRVFSGCVLLAIAYFIAAWLSLMMAIPPGYASPIWPAAGVALAALLLGGRGLWPGVFVGSLAANLVHAWPASDQLATAGMLSAGIAAGAVLQALLAATLVRRFVPGYRTLDADGDIIGFLLLGGPVGCLVSACVGVSALYAAGAIDAGTLAGNWVTWWAGDSLGALIGAPLCVLLFGAKRSGWRLRRLVVVLPVTLVAGMVIAFSLRASQLEVERLHKEFARHAESLSNAIAERIDRHVNALRSVEALYASSRVVEAEEFQRFASRLLPPHPGIHALTWDEVLADADRERFEGEMGRSEQPGFLVRERNPAGRLVVAGKRERYVVVRHVAPVKSNEGALGYDVYSNPVRAAALDHAADTGDAVATGRIHLVPGADEQAGFAVFMPVYADGEQPETVIQRRAGLVGFAAAVYRVADLVGAVREGLPADDVGVRVEDRSALSGAVVLYEDTDQSTSGSSYPLSFEQTIDVAGREWQLRFTAGPGFLDTYAEWQASAVMLGGLVFTGLLEALLLLFSARAGAVSRLVAERTGELTEANRALEREIAERVASHDALERAKQTAEAANTAKNEFLANISHEIRTPMNAILGLTQLSLDDRLDPEQRDNLELVQGSARSLLVIINEILDFSRIEAGRLTLRPVEFEPGELVHSVSRMLRGGALQKALVLDTRVDDQVPRKLLGDAAAVRQILVNLVGNAIKFTERGSVVVTLRLHSREETAVVVEFEVRDTGAGIPRERQSAIFEPFCQADNSTTRAHSGTGLGLTICARLAEAMNGEILVDSCPGDGSRFVCRLPLGIVTPSSSSEVRETPAPLASKRAPLRVLLAEDNPVNQTVASRLLKKLGHEVQVANDGREAVSAVRNGSFDLILMDLQMPEMDGMEALRAIRAWQAEHGLRTPVVALTAHASDEDRQRCLAAGMDGFIVKPFDFDEFASILDDFGHRSVA